LASFGSIVFKTGLRELFNIALNQVPSTNISSSKLLLSIFKCTVSDKSEIQDDEKMPLDTGSARSNTMKGSLTTLLLSKKKHLSV
jgi:hypothetical protein